MKQHITIEQLNELSANGKEKLREWWKPKIGDIHTEGTVTEIVDDDNGFYLCYGFDGDGFRYKKEEIFPLLSIGQMIEYLFDEGLSYAPVMFPCTDGKNKLYTVGKQNNEPKELCDALWEAVKEVLEEK